MEAQRDSAEWHHPAETYKMNVIANEQRRRNVALHVNHFAALLASEWLVEDAPARAWHARYIDNPGSHLATLYDLVLVQRRHVAGFSVARISDGGNEYLNSSIAVTLAGAVIWLGIDHLDYLLDWRHEL